MPIGFINGWDGKLMKQLKGIDGKLDKAWSELVKLKAGMKCEIELCGQTKYLNSHHIFTRKNRSVRWNTINGVCLCPSHHVLSSKFSAHGTPTLFTNWLIKSRGQKRLDTLTLKATSISKLHTFEKEFLLKELKKQINKLKTNGRINQKSK